eukprot:scaffold22586_cov138-Cylindrotheca_fusiformis.AAC.32
MSTPRTPSSEGLNNRFNSYQKSGSYVPPGQGYAEQQTNVLSDTVKTQYQTENTANAVLQQLNTQRQQIQGANDDVWDMRNATEATKRELRELQEKYRARKRKLYMYIAVLGTEIIIKRSMSRRLWRFSFSLSMSRLWKRNGTVVDNEVSTTKTWAIIQ